MKKEFTAYLKQLGVTKPIQEKVEYFYRLCKNILPSQSLVDIFVDEYLNEDKSRNYTGLTFYSEDYTFSVNNFLMEDKILVLPHQGFRELFEIKTENFEFRNANDQSLMTIDLYVGKSSSGQYRASQKNCEHLVRIFRKYIMPKL